ncbi:MAG: methyl-accepting chemotaxis protein [Anaerovibrio sp.]|nr:methyl-accepting chemotaxis protein [Anaerovibrio sp.]
MISRLFSNMNLSKKLVISFWLLSFIPVVLVAMVSMNTLYNDRLEEVKQHNSYVANLKAGEMSEILLNQSHFMTALADTDAIQSMDRNRMVSALISAKSQSSSVANMFICDANGQQVARDSGNYVNVGDRAYIQAVLRDGKAFAFSDAILSKATNQVMIICVVPIKQDGKVIGAMASTFNMATLKDLLNDNTNMLEDRQEIVYINDTKGNVMIHPDTKFTAALTNFDFMPPVKEAMAGKAYSGKYVNADGVECYGSSAALPDLGWSIVVENKASEVMSVVYTTVGRIAVITLIISLVVIAFAIFMARSFAGPLQDMAEKTQQVADGDLTVRLAVNSGDEIGQVSQSFNQMAGNMHIIMEQIATAAQQVAAGSKNISDSGNILAKGASTQAASVEELSSSISEIAAQTQGNAQKANEANTLTAEANVKAKAGNKRMGEMLSAMGNINESSAEIAKIIKVIDEIAFQTNILALNAAVEAARAGQHGKGFAVVAEEVRNLAARSAAAAKTTTEIIERSIEMVNSGTDLAKDTAEALKLIQDSIDKVTELVASIDEASQKQSSALNMLNQGVMQVSKVVQSNSASAEESASASVELNSQAEILQEAVNRFKL